MRILSRARRRIAVAAGTALTTALLGATVLPTAPAAADTDPPEGTPPTVSADPLPTWQVDGVVWSMTTVGSTVYATGNFTKARPPGAKAGDAREVARKNILAFDITTGDLVTSFNHSLNGQGLRIVASPDGKRVYVGGEFTTVDGQVRERIAAFDTATGALVPNFKPSVSAKVRGIAATNSTVYFGGNFFNVNGKSRQRLAAVKAADGTNLDAWKPVVDDEVMAMAMAPGDQRVLVGGKFQNLNGAQQVGIGAVDAASGAARLWTSKPIPTRLSAKTNMSYVTDLHVQGDTVFASADGEGGHWFDGRFAAKADNGDLVWLDNCYGASYGIFAQGKSVYSVSHAHDCSSLGAFPETNPQTWHRALAETSYPTGTDQAPPGANSNYSKQPIPSLLHWYPTLAMGTFTKQYQAAWAVTGNSDYVAMGGEFPRVNGKAQQGLVRFALKNRAPNKVGPEAGTLAAPVAQSLPGGVRVGWKTTWDMDNQALTYEVLRDNGTTPIGVVERKSTFWEHSNLAFLDRTAQPGASHTYKVRVKDSAGNTVTSAASNAASAGSGSTGPYVNEVNGDGADHLWRLGEGGGTSYDYAGSNDLTVASGAARGQAGAIKGDADHATAFNGTAEGTASSASATTPRDFSVEAWVKTTAKTGGKIIGYGNRSSGASTSYDRQLYLTNDGRAVFGVYPGATKTIRSDAGLNDGRWHHVVGTLSGEAGMKLYVDGKQVAADADVKGGQAYAGFWRVGGDNLGGWPDRPAGDHLNGTLDEVAVYPKALSGTEVARHHGVGTGATTPNQPPTAAFDASCTWEACAFDASASADPDGSVAAYAWDFGDGKTGTGAKASHTYAAAGNRTVKLTVTDNTGASTETTKVVAVRTQNLAADTFTRKVTSGWGSADTGGAWTPLGTGQSLAVGGAIASILHNAKGTTAAASLNAVSSGHTDVKVKVAVNKLTTGNGVAIWLVGRKVPGGGEYRARARLLPNGGIGLQFSRTDAAGKETMIGAEKVLLGVTYKAGAGMWMRMEAGGSPTSLKAKVWPNNGSAEPGWQISATDSTAALQKAGAIGLRTYVASNATNAPITVWVDDLKALRLK
ncbi:LamG-like jellyroll fold domain-containing protein [Spirillospora sp. NPDC127200]